MKLFLKEPLSARYFYLSPDNTLHVFMPVVGGTSIGLDNTCKAVLALQEFFNKGSSLKKKASFKAELLYYKEALECDIQLLEKDSVLGQQKQVRLRQIDVYLKALRAIENHPELNSLKFKYPSFPRPLEAMMQDQSTSNLYSMVLRPTLEDLVLRTEGCNPVFSVAHNSWSRNINLVNSPLQFALMEAYRPLTFVPKDAKALVKNRVLQKLAELKSEQDKPFSIVQALTQLLTKEIQDQMHVSIDFTKTIKGELINQSFFSDVMFFEEEDTTPDQYFDALVSLCAKELFTNPSVSPFHYLTQVEEWSVATQFLLGIINFYAVSKGKTGVNTNFGRKLDEHPDLSADLARTLAQAHRNNTNIEEACILWINRHATQFQLVTEFTPDDLKAIGRELATRYNQIRDSQHFDEFILLDTEKQGRFVTHQGSISISFAEFVNSPLFELPQDLTQPLERVRCQVPSLGVEIPHSNTLVRSQEYNLDITHLDTDALQDLYKRIENYPDSAIRVKLFAQLKAERPDFKPYLKTFLRMVANGEQNEAELLLQKDPTLAQTLLTGKNQEFTDNAGRTFKCTAYEYAWWAKDSHMRFMMENYMDDNTKQILLKRVEDIDGLKHTGEFFKRPRGLVFTQNGKKHSSTHFDFTPLKKALNRYITAYNQSPKEYFEHWDALVKQWNSVGLPQRDLPAHIAQEYCHPKRSFEDVSKDPSLLDATNPLNLERELKYFNYLIPGYECWFSNSKLGNSFAILRSERRSAWVSPESTFGVNFMDSHFRLIDLLAIEALERARTAELRQSLANLHAPADKEHKDSLFKSVA